MSSAKGVLAVAAAAFGAVFLITTKASATANAKAKAKTQDKAQAPATSGAVPSADRTAAEKVAISTPLNGGCLCGAVRYRITPPSAETGDAKSGDAKSAAAGAGALEADAAYCHCRMCQRSCSAPAVPWVTVPLTAFALTQGAEHVTPYRSSAAAVREFCSRCGSQLVFRFTDGTAAEPVTSVDVSIASLDTPAAVPPRYHIWTMSRVQWFDTADALPRFTDRGLDTAK